MRLSQFSKCLLYISSLQNKSTIQHRWDWCWLDAAGLIIWCKVCWSQQGFLRTEASCKAGFVAFLEPVLLLPL